MSRHEGVSCDSCLIGNFRGKRYKCLICYDYDLCATCYESGATTTRHTTQHPMQCILTRTDFDLYYGGEAVSVEQPQSFTCPFCGRMGYTEHTLQDHVTAEHSDISYEVVCPICAALPGGDPNFVTEEFAQHLTQEHRMPRDLDEASGSRHVRRIPHTGRGVGAPRVRRANMHFSSSGGLAPALSPSSGRDAIDPIAELLSQLSGVRRSAAAAQSSNSSQLQQLQMQVHLERQQQQTARQQQLERLPRRQPHIGGGATFNAGTAVTTGGISSQPVMAQVVAGLATATTTTSAPVALPATDNTTSNQYLLSRFVEPTVPESKLCLREVSQADRSVFIQELILNALASTVQGLPPLPQSSALHILSDGTSGDTSLAKPPAMTTSASPTANNGQSSVSSTLLNANASRVAGEKTSCPRTTINPSATSSETAGTQGQQQQRMSLAPRHNTLGSSEGAIGGSSMGSGLSARPLHVHITGGEGAAAEVALQDCVVYDDGATAVAKRFIATPKTSEANTMKVASSITEAILTESFSEVNPDVGNETEETLVADGMEITTGRQALPPRRGRYTQRVPFVPEVSPRSAYSPSPAATVPQRALPTTSGGSRMRGGQAPRESTSRRKFSRLVDNRNHLSEPPPPH